MLRFVFALLFALLLDAAAETRTHALYGKASWYGAGWKRTASGERYDVNSMTAAHRTLPFNTRVRVTHLVTRRTTVVRINNRGPYVRGRVIDLSPAAARELQMINAGVAPVELQVMRLAGSTARPAR
jgi:rare lipoprotein A